MTEKTRQSADPVVAIFGSSSAVPGEAAYEEAVLVGAKLGELGYSVVTGGYGGLMEAVSRGASGRCARVIGVTCQIWKARANPYLTEAIDTGDIFARVQRLIEIGQAGFVTLGGGTGTLLEVATAWEVVFKKMIPPRPIVCLGDGWQGLIQMVAPVQPKAGEVIHFIQKPSELERYFPPRV